MPNSISIGSDVFAQLTAGCPYTLQWAAPFSLSKLPFYGGSELGILNSFFNIRSLFATIRILLEVRKGLQRPGDDAIDAQRPPPLLHYLITQQVVHARPSGNHQRETAHLPTTTDASSKRPTTHSKDHDVA